MKIKLSAKVDGITSAYKNLKEKSKFNRIDTSESKLRTVLRCVIGTLCMVLIPIVLFYLMEGYQHNAWEEVRSLAQVYNILLFELIAWILFFFTGKVKTALRIETLFACLYGIVNHYIMEFRSTPFVPWDIFSIRTGISVADNYDFTPSKEMLFVTGVFVVLFLALGFVKFHLKKNLFLRSIPFVCLSCLLAIFVNCLQDDEFQTDSYLYPYLFTPAHMTKVNGMMVTFAMNLEYVYVEKPSGYSVENAKQILASYEKNENSTNDSDESKGELKKDLPNIIVIMNEAFSDLSVLGDFTTNEDYMPFLHKLQNGYENTITGNLTVSVCGGNTANSEFEFLTGHTMDFFPVGSIPYQQYIKGEIPSIVNQLSKLGYLTYGLHPYNASGWNRDTVYEDLGFSKSFFLSDFTNRRYIRNYVSDETSYQKIIDLYEKKEEGTPLFAFEVTMQNHGGYTDLYENFTPNIYVEEFTHLALNQYLSLIKVSDSELEQLISYFEKEEEDTMIVFFGDHQPNDYVVNPILRFNGETTPQLRYIVPYVIWANFDISEEKNADTDISYLSAKVLKTAGISTNAYQNFLLEMEEVMNTNDDEKESLELKVQYQQMHQILQYYLMFDKKFCL